MGEKTLAYNSVLAKGHLSCATCANLRSLGNVDCTKHSLNR